MCDPTKLFITEGGAMCLTTICGVGKSNKEPEARHAILGEQAYSQT